MSSWLLRIAAKKGKIPHQIIQELHPGLQVWNRDVDLLAPVPLRVALTTATGEPQKRVDDLCLSSLEGVIDETIDCINQSQHIRPLGTYHRTRRANGQQYCPVCLGEEEPFFRLRWRLTLFPACPKHGVLLHDACHSCDAPVVPHRGRIFACHECDAPHSLAPIVAASSEALQHQAMNEKVLDGGSVWHPFLRGLHPISFFAIQHRILATLIKSGRGRNLRSALPHYLRPEEPEFRGRRREARNLTPRSTHDYMRAVSYLMRGFPITLVAACQEAGVFKSWLLSDARYRQDPFVLKDAAHHYLSPGSANNRLR